MLCDISELHLVCDGVACVFPPKTGQSGDRRAGPFSATGVMPVKFNIEGDHFLSDKLVTVELDDERIKKLMKEAYRETIDEWLDRKQLQFTRWSFAAALSGIVAGIAWLVVTVEMPTWLVNHLPKVH